MKLNKTSPTFVYEINSFHDQEQTNLKEDFTLSNIREESLTKVYDAYQDLNTNISSLDKKIGRILQSREHDIIEAFKVEMQVYLNDLNELKKKYHDFMRRAESDPLTIELKKEVAFHITENKALTNQLNKIEEENRKLREKVFFLEEDRKFLSEYVIKTTKKTAVTKFDKTSDRKANPRISSSQSRPITPLKSSIIPKSKNNSARDLKLESNNEISKGDDIFSFTRIIGSKYDQNNPYLLKLRRIFDQYNENLQTNNIYEDVEKIIKESIIDYEDKLKRVKEESKQIKIKLTNQINMKNAEKNQLEMFFLECIENVKIMIKKRKFKHIRNKSMDYIEENHNPEDSLAFDEFLLNDKMRLLELFVENDAVKNIIKSLMFSHNDKRIELSKEPNLAYSKFPINNYPNFSNHIIENTLHNDSVLKNSKGTHNNLITQPFVRKHDKTKEKLSHIIKKMDRKEKMQHLSELSIVSTHKYSSIDFLN